MTKTFKNKKSVAFLLRFGVHSWCLVCTNSLSENICEVLQNIFAFIIICVGGRGKPHPIISD